jgi:hypothetical protein
MENNYDIPEERLLNRMHLNMSIIQIDSICEALNTAQAQM